jgi:tRNA (guanine-N7-)-methyltransferase
MDNGQWTMDNEALSSFDLSIRTYYEQQWLSRGLSIKYLRFRLPAEGALEEPDVEIELDDYRSYNREKRSSLATSK